MDVKHVIIDVVGTHSTGKTTLIKDFKYLCDVRGYQVKHVESVSRPAACSGEVEIYEKTVDTGQAYMSMVNWGEILHSGMCNHITLCTDLGIRSLAYTLTAPNITKELQMIHKQWLDIIRNFVHFSPYLEAYWIYLPIEFDLVEDGVRSTDEGYRMNVDSNIRHIIKSCNLPVTTIVGDKQQRLTQAKTVLKQIMFQKTKVVT